jgi:hypothetical protein
MAILKNAIAGSVSLSGWWLSTNDSTSDSTAVVSSGGRAGVAVLGGEIHLVEDPRAIKQLDARADGRGGFRIDPS